MKALFLISLLLALAGCASQYREVYVSPEGDYYIEERSSESVYYSLDSVVYADIGFYPWWVTIHNPLTFTYYSPNYYPYYFSIWYPPVFQPFYGYYRGYYSYWCPPYRRRHETGISAPIVIPDGGGNLPPQFSGRGVIDQRDIWQPVSNQGFKRPGRYSGNEIPRGTSPARAMTPGPSISSFSTPGMDISRASGPAMSTMRADPVSPSNKNSSFAPDRNKQ